MAEDRVSGTTREARLPIADVPDGNNLIVLDKVEPPTAEERAARRTRRRVVLFEKATEFGIYVVIVAVAIFILVGVGAVLSVVAQQYTWKQFQGALVVKGGLLYLASWLVLLVISGLATVQLRELLEQSRVSTNRLRANYIAIVIGLVLVVILFKQPFLDQLFTGQTAGGILKSLLIGGGAVTGWLAWYLKNLRKYGEFFHVLLFTIVVGFCWYARLTAPEQVQTHGGGILVGFVGAPC